MKTIKIIAGLTWAFLCMVIVIALFPSLNPLAQSTSKFPFMKINPNYSGGEIVREYNKNSYTINIRRPVFDGLIGERRNGFVQIDWRGKLPQTINDTIDFDGDSKNDFVVQIDTLKVQCSLIPLSPKVGKLEISTATSYGWAVRVGLVK
jgi:hypothetical protein